MKKDDQAKAEYLRQRSDHYKCKAGNKRYCSYAQNHPVKTIAFTATALVAGPLAYEFIVGGGAASTIQALGHVAQYGYDKAVLACLISDACRQLTGMAGGLDSINNAASANNSSFRVFNSEAKGPITSHQVTVIGKTPQYMTWGQDLNANALNVGEAYSDKLQSSFEQGVIARQDFLVLSSMDRSGTFGQEVSRFVANGFADAVRFLIPPTMGH